MTQKDIEGVLREEAPLTPGSWTYNDHGLYIATNTARSHGLTMFYPDVLIGDMDFMPGYSTMPEKLLEGLYGLKGFFEKIDNESKPEPEYLYGETNIKMATITKSIGFEIKDLTPKLSNPDHKSYQVVGKTKEVRRKFGELLDRKNSYGENIIDVVSRRVDSARRLTNA